MKLYAYPDGTLARVPCDELPHPVYGGLLPNTSLALELDRDTNGALIADMEADWDSYAMVGEALCKDGAPVAVNPPGPDAVQQAEARDYHAQLDTAITFLQGAITAWPTMTATQRTTWIRDNMDKVLRVELGLLRMVRWAVRRLGL